MRLRLAALAPLLAAALACASSQSLPDPRAQSTMSIGSAGGSPALVRYFRDVNSVVDTLPVPASRVWARLPAAYASVGIPLSVADSNARTLGAVRVPMRNRLGTRQLSAFVDCGLTPTGTPRANRYVVSITALTQVQDVPGGKSVVRTAVAASARDDATSSPDLQCGSSGRIEQMLTDAVRAGL